MPTLRAPDGPEADGHLGGRYRLGKVIGGGGGGTVHEGSDLLLRRPVAIKEIRLPPMGSAAARELAEQRVMREARAAARLRHPGLVAVYDVVQAEGRSWIVMEYVDGVPLSQLVRDFGRLAPERVARIGVTLAYALEAAHRAGVVHRDVKPGNVLVTADGQSRLTDFGIAVSRGDSTLTGAGTLVGSPAYIAPERVRGARAVYASDVWGLGATLFTAVEGAPPFEAEGLLPLLAAVVENRRRPFIHAGSLRDVIDSMLDADPGRRPSLSQIRSHLHEVLDGLAPAVNGRRGRGRRAAALRRPSRPHETGRPDPWLELLADSHRLEPADGAGQDFAADELAESGVNVDVSDPVGLPEAGEVGALTADETAERLTDDESVDTGGAGDAGDWSDLSDRDGLAEPGDTAQRNEVTTLEAEAEAEADRDADLGGRGEGDGTSVLEAAAEPAGVGGSRTTPIARAGNRRRPRRRTLLIAAAALVALAAVGTPLGLALAGNGGPAPTAALAGPKPSIASSGQISSGTPTPPAGSSSPSGPASSVAGPSSAGVPATDAAPGQSDDTSLGTLIPTSTAPAQPPTGSTTRSGLSGWSVAVPSDWPTAPRGADRLVFAPASGYPELLVEAQAAAGSSAIGAWRSLEGSVQATSPGYHLLSIRPADGGDGANAAVYEFTFTSGGRTIHVLDLGVIRNGHGYALRWRMPQDAWTSQQAQMRQIFATFRPGP
ncbi:protein kinase [Frankia sp. AgB1.9]|uniref:serine/threonine-protein kinase n=1 Tax=unclassified Frankia TaxID=2632575 RepID=UPI001933B9F3|nr:MULTISPECIES: serine/threonine-protein kinase [unclassified Frankia]MBL7487005.1 protein kinase [Frankia sp. AgW1.1]MBL7552031.1 protein kinase [Frankia sp. AgB1.9]MBL7623350.1 protein kinase [Frankia sp. AgB1.8]